jgi:cell division protein FtsI/penicillin-binding protein 2
MREKLRLLPAIGLLIALFVTAAAKLVEIQILEHERWRQEAEKIHVRQLTQSHPRGRIYDRNGLLLAFDVKATSIALDNYHMTKPELLQRLLERHLGLSAEQAEKLIYRPSYFTWIARKVDPNIAGEIKREAASLGIRGLILIPEWKRVYPQGELASNVIGFAGLDNQGLEGVELAFDELLRGTPRRSEVVLGADGTRLEERIVEPGSPGADIHLTIDAHIQLIAERAIREGVQRSRAKGGFAAVLDPKTGEILALAQDKTYDLNEFERSSPKERLNLAVAYAFEPGSAFKPFAMLAALEAGVVGLNERINGDQPVIIAGHRFHNAEQISYGPVTPQEIIAKSINTGMIRIALRLGEERLYTFLKGLGFGEETGMGLPGEVGGLLRPLEEWSKLEIGAIPIGQGISVTGIQLASRYAALANGGSILKPKIIYKVDPPADRDLEPGLSGESGVTGPIASRANLEALREMMVRVVSEEGTGILARIEGFEVAGKSGTGQKALPGLGYVKGKYTSVFVGFFPAYKPQYLILVVLDEVGTRYFYGGQTAAPIFKEIVEGIIALKRLKPKLMP